MWKQTIKPHNLYAVYNAVLDLPQVKMLNRSCEEFLDSPHLQEAVLSVWPKLHDRRHSETEQSTLFHYLQSK